MFAVPSNLSSFLYTKSAPSTVSFVLVHSASHSALTTSAKPSSTALLNFSGLPFLHAQADSAVLEPGHTVFIKLVVLSNLVNHFPSSGPVVLSWVYQGRGQSNVED